MNQNLNLNIQPQQQTEWCWSAVAVSVSHFYNSGSGWIQCDVVNNELGQTTCCQGGATRQCNKPWYLDAALRQTGNLDHVSSGSLPFPQVTSEVSKQKPLGVRIGWAGGGGHFVAVTGYDDSDPVNQLVYVSDPDPGTGPSWVSYNTLVSGYQGSGSWTDCYFTKP